MSSYFLYIQSRKDNFKAKDIKTYQIQAKSDWMKLSSAEKTKFEKQAQELMIKYK